MIEPLSLFVSAIGLCCVFHLVNILIAKKFIEIRAELLRKSLALIDSIRETAEKEGLAQPGEALKSGTVLSILQRYVDEGLAKSHETQHGLRMAYIIVFFAAHIDGRNGNSNVRNAVSGMVKKICETCGPMPDKVDKLLELAYENALVPEYWEKTAQSV